MMRLVPTVFESWQQAEQAMGVGAERLRRESYHLSQMLGGFELRGRRALEIGCGSGLYCCLMALNGAQQVVGLEPELAGATAGVLKSFNERIEALKLNNLRAQAVTFQDFVPANRESFDLVLTHSVINHLDERACTRLHRDREARQAYARIFRDVRAMMNPGGLFVLADCARHNLFSGTSRLGLYRGPFSRNITWDLHQGPRLWRRLLAEAGFGRAKLAYWVPYRLRHVPWLADNPLFSYLTISYFILRSAAPGPEAASTGPAGHDAKGN